MLRVLQTAGVRQERASLFPSCTRVVLLAVCSRARTLLLACVQGLGV